VSTILGFLHFHDFANFINLGRSLGLRSGTTARDYRPAIQALQGSLALAATGSTTPGNFLSGFL